LRRAHQLEPRITMVATLRFAHPTKSTRSAARRAVSAGRCRRRQNRRRRRGSAR
jgi:hypothetical protein